MRSCHRHCYEAFPASCAFTLAWAPFHSRSRHHGLLTALFLFLWLAPADAEAPCRCAYTNWTTTARGCDDFFTDPNVITLYKNHVQKVLTRVNSINGIPYQNDSTIFGEAPALRCAHDPVALPCYCKEPWLCWEASVLPAGMSSWQATSFEALTRLT